MSNLRKRLIRLAHDKPELRADILPLLKQAGGDLSTITRLVNQGKGVYFHLRNIPREGDVPPTREHQELAKRLREKERSYFEEYEIYPEGDRWVLHSLGWGNLGKNEFRSAKDAIRDIKERLPRAQPLSNDKEVTLVEELKTPTGKKRFAKSHKRARRG